LSVCAEDKTLEKHTRHSESSSDFSWFWTQLDAYLASQDLKQTKQRKLIVEKFLLLDSHVDAEKLHEVIRGEGHNVGLATVYRTLNLLKSAGLAEQQSFADGRAVFEVLVPHKHHDHLVCLVCGKVVEFINEKIEQLQLDVAKKHGFTLEDHRLDLYGHCRNCRNGASKSKS